MVSCLTECDVGGSTHEHGEYFSPRRDVTIVFGDVVQESLRLSNPKRNRVSFSIHPTHQCERDDEVKHYLEPEKEEKRVATGRRLVKTNLQTIVSDLFLRVLEVLELLYEFSPMCIERARLHVCFVNRIYR